MLKKLRKFKKNLCPLCLEELKNSDHRDCFPNGTVVIKRKNYALVKITKHEAIIKRVLMISNNLKDNSKEFIFLYVDNVFVGYKGTNLTWFISDLLDEEYKRILKDYIPRKERKKKRIELRWGF